MSGRRNGSVSRAAEAASKNRLHMDRNPQHTRITDPANPAGRRKEIDNVMKRARRGSPGTWDRKLLEVEERDPNRWRHTGYKQLYLDGSKSPSPKRSRSPVPRRSRSPIGRRSRSIGRRSRTPLRRSRSPIRRSRSPIRRSRSPIRRSRSPVRRTPRKSRSRTPRNAGKPSAIRRGSAGRRSPRPRSPRPRSPPPRARLRPGARPPSPPDPSQSSGSGSSMSSCSDESCSVCSAKNKKPVPPPPKPRPPEPSSKAVRPAPHAVQPTRELLKAREASKRTREEKVLEWQRSQLAVTERCPPLIPTAHIKREGSPGPRDPRQEPREPRPEQRVEREKTKRGVSPGAIMAALADTGSDSDNTSHSDNANQRMTLSERFGKMAQWSAARSARLENMKITRRSHALHVSIEKNRDDPEPDPEPSYPGLESAPVGSYPEELLAAAPGGLPSWDDVAVRYDYYKKRGYLRGLTLSDYVKWEEWWYKYQEWLKRERAYERWADGDMPPARRERRRRGGRHRRS